MTIGERVAAVERMCAIATDLIAEGRSMELSIHDVPGDVFDSFEGHERVYPEQNGHHAFRAKEVKLLNEIGQISVRLFASVEVPA